MASRSHLLSSSDYKLSEVCLLLFLKKNPCVLSVFDVFLMTSYGPSLNCNSSGQSGEKNSLVGGTDYSKSTSRYFLKFLIMLNHGIFCFRFRFCRRSGHLITSLKNGAEIQVDGHGCHLDSFWILHYFCFVRETRLYDEIRVFNY